MWPCLCGVLVACLVGCGSDKPSPPATDSSKTPSEKASGSAVAPKPPVANKPVKAASAQAQREFCKLVSQGDTEKVKAALKAKPALLMARGDFEKTPLHMAAETGRLPLVTYLVEQGADVNGLMRYKQTPLHLAAVGGHKEVAAFLLDHGAATDSDQWDETPLHAAAQYGQKEMIVLLLDHGANINAKDEHGEPPIEDAATVGNLEVYQLLVARGAKVDVGTNKNGFSILYSACVGGNIEIIKDLIDRGADVNAVGTNVDGVKSSPLSVSQGPLGNPEVVDLLGKHGAKE